jgi:hypothetical protein
MDTKYTFVLSPLLSRRLGFIRSQSHRAVTVTIDTLRDGFSFQFNYTDVLRDYPIDDHAQLPLTEENSY